MAVEEDPQQIAARSPRANLLVIAPPGCGKTELLALRAKELIPILQPNQRILALTFTNRAKSNLTDRLRKALGSERLRRYVTVHNFHGHATEVLLAHGRSLYLEPDRLRLPTTKTMRNALKQISSDSARNAAATELLSTIKRLPLDDGEVLLALDAAGDQLAKRVELERVQAEQLHYDDLLRHAQRLLRVDEIANLYRQHYGAVIVDEFQDLSTQQLELVMRSCSRSRTFAGDPLQGIYSWAGAEPQVVEQALRDVCGKPIQLTVSYRSSPAVLEMVNSVSARMGAEPLVAKDPTRWTDGGASAAIECPDKAIEAQLIAEATKSSQQTPPLQSGWSADPAGVVPRSTRCSGLCQKCRVAVGI
jgi:DNA helicase-2/ATP-dependent DNA helicase PcrA